MLTVAKEKLLTVKCEKLVTVAEKTLLTVSEERVFTLPHEKVLDILILSLDNAPDPSYWKLKHGQFSSSQSVSFLSSWKVFQLNYQEKTLLPSFWLSNSQTTCPNLLVIKNSS